MDFTSLHYLVNDMITNCIIRQQIIWTMDDSPIYCIWPITNWPNQSISKQEALIMLIIADHQIRLKCLTSFLGMADHSAEHMVNHVAESHGSPHGSLHGLSHAPGHTASFWISARSQGFFLNKCRMVQNAHHTVQKNFLLLSYKSLKDQPIGDKMLDHLTNSSEICL